MRFEHYGPFDITPTYVKSIMGAPKGYWNGVNNEVKGLSSAHGCYIFGVRSSGGKPSPWYVGQAQKSFSQECFQPHKIVRYQYVLAEHYKKGVPFLIFTARLTGSGSKFAKPPANKSVVIEELEGLLIGQALKRNGNLVNVKRTRFWSDVTVPGLLKSPVGPPSPGTKEFKKILGL